MYSLTGWCVQFDGVVWIVIDGVVGRVRGGWSRVIDCHLSCDKCVANLPNAYGAS